MNKHTIEINVPEGYEPDEGEQPRLPRVGDILMDDCFDVCEQVCEPLSKRHVRKAIILRKKKPAYFSQVNQVNTEEGWKMKTMVEVKALEDAMKIIENMNTNPDLDMFECNAYGPLKELLK